MDINSILTRGVVEIIEKQHLKAALESGRKLRVKLGIDPTSPNIHIGRAVVLWKLRKFQELGHRVIFIVGDFTGLIGDTSDKDAERPMLSEKEIQKNIKNYFFQAFKILDKNKTETHYNSQWLKKLGFKEISEMADLFGLHEFEAREVIARRLKAGKRVSTRELLYPVMQGYDSVAVKADMELGGTDQRFNLLAGRTIQKHYGQPPQDIMITELLEGTDGRKMSSSWGNVINILDEPDEMFGKVMSISDRLIPHYFELCTDILVEGIQEIKTALEAGEVNPKDIKEKLAKQIVEIYHGPKPSEAAEEEFEVKFGRAKGEIKADYELKKKPGEYILVDILIEGKLASSKSEARRKIKEGAVDVAGVKVEDEKAKIKLAKGSLIRLGKRFLRIN